MSVLFNRQFSLNLGGTLIASSVQSDDTHKTLRIQFKIEKDLTKIPNNAEIAVWNLAPQTRTKLSEAQILPTILSVGYGTKIFQVFAGDLYHASSQRDGPNWVTKMSFKDGGKNQNDARVNESFAPGFPLGEAIKSVASKTGLGFGNLGDHLTNVRSGVDVLPRGATVSGNAIDEFGKLMGYTGQTWSVQDGQIQVLIPGQTLPLFGSSEVINVDTGMIGAPEVGDKGQTKFRALIRPGLFPGFPVQIESTSGIKSGSFLIIHSVFTGDTHGPEWTVECECFPLGKKSRPATEQTGVA